MDSADKITGSAVAQIAELAKASVQKAPKIMEAKGEPAGSYYLVDADGKAVLTHAAPDWHRERLATPSEVVAFAKAREKEDVDRAIFFSDADIRYVFDVEDRRAFATCDLPRTPQYATLAAKIPPMKQSDFIRLLRITLRDCVPADSGLLNLVRNLKFNVTQDGSGAITHGRESIGRSVQAQLTGESSIPEEVRLNLQVYENYAQASSIMCAIEIFPQEQTLQLIPYPGEVRRAMDETLEWIRDTLNQAKVPVFRGQP